MTTPDHSHSGAHSPGPPNPAPPPANPGGPPPGAPPGVKMVQVRKDELDELLVQHQQILTKNKKLENQLRAMTNLTDVISKQENIIHMSRKKAQQYESAYIASESKLGRCLKLLVSSKDGAMPDIDAIEDLIRVKQEDLYTEELTEYDSKTKRESRGLVGGDLETDCDSDSRARRSSAKRLHKEQSGDQQAGRSDNIQSIQQSQSTAADSETTESETTESETEGNSRNNKTETKKVQFHQAVGSDDGNNKTAALDGRFGDSTPKSTMGLNNTGDIQMNEIVNKLIKDKRQLKSIVDEFESEKPEAWKAFLESKRYENLVRNLRLEIANERIHTSQLQYLLAAKQEGSDNTLTKRAADLDKKVSKLTKQLAVKQTLLNSLKSEYDRLRSEKRHKTVSAEIVSQMFDIKNDGDLEKNLRLLKEKCEGIFEANEREIMELKRTVEELRSENEGLREESKTFAADLQEAQTAPKLQISSSDDQRSSSWLYLKEENDRLQNQVTAYKHELEAKMRGIELAQSQIQMQQKEYQTEKQTRLTAEEKFTEDKNRLISTLKITEQKYKQSQTQLQHRENECFRLQQQFDKLHMSYSELSQQLQQMSQYKAFYDSMSRTGNSSGMRSQQQQQPPYIGGNQSLFDSHLTRQREIYAGGSDIQEDYSDSPQTSPSYAHRGDSTARVVEGRVVSGLDATKEAPIPPGVVGKQGRATSDDLEYSGDYEKDKEGSSLEVLECPQCYREFNVNDREKYDNHCKKCMTG